MAARFGDGADDGRTLDALSVRSSSSSRCRPGAVIGNFCTARSSNRKQTASSRTHRAKIRRRGRACAWPRRVHGSTTAGRSERSAKVGLQRRDFKRARLAAPRWRAPRPGRRPWWCSAARRGSARCGGCRNCRRPTARPEAVLITSWTSPERIASTQCGRPSSTLFTTVTASPASRMRAAVPRVARMAKPMSVSRRASGDAGRSCRHRCTERNTVPLCGSFTPAPSCDLAKARSKLASSPITSPVDFISGPRMVSTFGKRANGNTASFTATCGAIALVVEAEVRQLRAGHDARADLGDRHAGRLGDERHGARGARIDLQHVDRRRP